MPTYLYKCMQCEAEQEYEHKMNEKPALICPKCVGSFSNNLGAVMKRQIGYKPNISFRGEGFHAIDYPGSKVPR